MRVLNFLLVLICFCIAFTAIGQEVMPKIILGVESSYRFTHVFDERSTQSLGGFEYGVSLERPIFNKFSLSVGFNKSELGEIRDYEPNPEISEQHYTANKYQVKNTSIPIRFIYRLKCNCVYFHVSYVAEFMEQELLNSYSFELRDGAVPRFSRYDSLNRNNSSVEAGIGFKYHFAESFRVYFRTEVKQFLNSYYFEENKPIANKFIKFSLGLQKAIF